jgi:AcrR family transcriptional regulator
MRAALLAAAERLIETDGPDAASVRAVADSVGTTTRAVYSVFGSKDGMLAALATRLFELLAEAIDACETSNDPVNDVVTISLGGFRRTALAFGRLEAHLAVLEARGQLGETPVRTAARAVHAITEGLATMELRGMISAESGAEEVWRTAIHALLNGFALA